MSSDLIVEFADLLDEMTVAAESGQNGRPRL